MQDSSVSPSMLVSKGDDQAPMSSIELEQAVMSSIEFKHVKVFQSKLRSKPFHGFRMLIHSKGWP